MIPILLLPVAGLCLLITKFLFSFDLYSKPINELLSIYCFALYYSIFYYITFKFFIKKYRKSQEEKLKFHNEDVQENFDSFSETEEQVLTGKIAVGGVTIAKILNVKPKQDIKKENCKDIEGELRRFSSCLENVKEEIVQEIKTGDSRSSEILEAQLLILEDAAFIDAVKNNIVKEKVCAEYAALKAGESIADEFRHMENTYMQARCEDIEQIAQRIIDKLIGSNSKIELKEPVILMAEEFSPAQLAVLDKKYVKGMVSNKGNASSHTAILAANYGLPFIIGIEPNRNFDNILAILDGNNGKLILNPNETSIDWTKNQLEIQEKIKNQSDINTKMKVLANISSLEDVELALDNKADGIGLFRTEFLFMNRNDAPSEEEQFEVYKKVLDNFRGKPVIIRTIDIGTDKPAPYLNIPKEENPALGFRGIRVSLAFKDLFKNQLRALLRAAVYGDLHVMFPMITSMDEVIAFKKEIESVSRDLKTDNVSYAIPKLGIMIETPAAALCSEDLGKVVDFFSIGTNDLTQYTLALDRQTEGLESYYKPHHDAILKLIEMTVEGAHKNGIPVGICGQLGSDESLIPVFVKMGLDEVSVAISTITKVRNSILKAESDACFLNNTINEEIEVGVPVEGQYVSMKEIPDATFSEGLLGECFAVIPENGHICAPVSGVVSSISDTGHAISINSGEQEFLVHIGIDTVKLRGKGFDVKVNIGQVVALGDLLVDVDLDYIVNAGYNPMVVTVKLASNEEESVVNSANCDKNEFTYIIKDPIGIHARPAGEIVSLVKDLDVKVTFTCNGKTSDAKSIINIMKLEAKQGNELSVKLEGNDAQKAHKVLKEYLKKHL